MYFRREKIIAMSIFHILQMLTATVDAFCIFRLMLVYNIVKSLIIEVKRFSKIKDIYQDKHDKHPAIKMRMNKRKTVRARDNRHTPTHTCFH